MGLMKNLKNWFNEDDEPIADDEVVANDIELSTKFEPVEIKEPRREYRQEPIVEEKEDEQILSERELFRSERTFGFPVEMDEKEEEPRQRVNVLEYEKKINTQTKKEDDIEKRKFKPSPILSPVYGILDQNYKKEDVTVREVKNPVVPKDKVSFDSIRSKAFGDLADDIEKTFAEDTALFFNLKEELAKEEKSKVTPEEDITLKDAEDVYKDFGVEYDKDKSRGETKDLRELIDLTPEKPVQNKVEETKKREIKVTVGKDEEVSPITIEEEKEERLEKTLEKTNSELFDLIDSMYDERKE